MCIYGTLAEVPEGKEPIRGWYVTYLIGQSLDGNIPAVRFDDFFAKTPRLPFALA